jgi:two-component system, OmpR family, sensor histidine kinase SaeS
MRGGIALVAVAAVIGAVATLAGGAIVGMPPGDTARLVLMLGASSLVVLLWTVIGSRWLAGSSLRHRFLAVAVVGVVVALSSLGAVAALMFVSGHDASLLAVVLVSSAVVGVGAALALTRTTATALRRLTGTAEALASGDLGARVGTLGADSELVALGRTLDEMAERLETSISRERDLEARRRDLMTAVSHDLRTPLAGLRAMVEAIDEGVVGDPPSLRRYAREMRRAVGSLSTLVDDLFELAQIDAGAIEREAARISVEDLVRSAVAEVEGRAEEKGLSLETSVAGAAGALCSPRLLRVLQNLLHNAIRHTPADGTVRIEASRDGAGLQVAVEDTGEGIAPEVLDRVFEPFWQADPARSGDGSGLGLALAKRIVEALGGRIEVRSGRAQGSRFAVWVPERTSGAALAGGSGPNGP